MFHVVASHPLSADAERVLNTILKEFDTIGRVRGLGLPIKMVDTIITQKDSCITGEGPNGSGLMFLFQ